MQLFIFFFFFFLSILLWYYLVHTFWALISPEFILRKENCDKMHNLLSLVITRKQVKVLCFVLIRDSWQTDTATRSSMFCLPFLRMNFINNNARRKKGDRFAIWKILCFPWFYRWTVKGLACRLINRLIVQNQRSLMAYKCNERRNKQKSTQFSCLIIRK